METVKENNLISIKDIGEYCNYIKSLSPSELTEEYLLVKNIANYIDTYFLAVKSYIEKTLVNDIKRSVANKEDTLEAVNKHLTKIKELRNNLEKIEQSLNLYFKNPFMRQNNKKTKIFKKLEIKDNIDEEDKKNNIFDEIDEKKKNI